jgi:threonine/homoserine/homoserine lactone efflux protein
MNAVSFFLSSLIIILMPGTGVVYTVSNGISGGRRAGFFAALGCTLGIVPHLCLSIALSSLMLRLSSRVFDVIKLAGAVYLLYLGIGMLRNGGSQTVGETQERGRVLEVVRRGVLINLLNPKLTVFFFAFLPQYVSSGGNGYVLRSFLLGLAFMGMTLLVFTLYAMLAGSAKRLIESTPKRMSVLQRCFGVLFVLFALKLGLSSL